VNRYLRLVALLGALALVGAACGRGGQEDQGGTGNIDTSATFRGGLESDVDSAFDPQKEYYSVTWGFYHCCLLRTLVTTPPVDATQGGNELQPDLATALPEVSDDELTYTFTLKDGIEFGPPVARAITAQDFITAMEREANPKAAAGYPFYYDIIEGFTEFADGEADTISGMTAVSDTELDITLTRPAGDFPFRMMMPAAAPVPAEAAEGHDKDYGRYLVSSGPYMFEGSENLDFAGDPVTGYDPGRSIVMVHNPNWDQETDTLRQRNFARIEVQIGLTSEDMAAKTDAGELDMALDSVPPPTQIRQYQSNPDLQDQLHSNQGDGDYYLSFNIAEPPFDDVNVRKAVNFAVDKAGLMRVRGGPLFGEVAGHIIPSFLLGDQLADFDAYPTENSEGDVEAAKAAMAESDYDSDGDGVCDAPECQDILSVTDEADPYPDQARVIQTDLEELGLTLDVNALERTTMYDKCNDPGAHVAFCMGPGWFKDYADATTFGEPLFGSAAIGPDSCCNYSLVGAPADVLQEHGYEVTEVPSVDEKIEECDTLPLGDERYTCFAELDTQLMEDVVPWVPINFAKDVFVTSTRVLNYTYDQFSGQPSLAVMGVSGPAA
jgi:peptide/nickel transport system substrate-binding protein